MKKILVGSLVVASLSFANCGSDKEVEFVLPLKDRNVQDRITKAIVPTPVEKIDVACVDSYDDLYFVHDGKTYNIGGTYEQYIKFISRGAKW